MSNLCNFFTRDILGNWYAEQTMLIPTAKGPVQYVDGFCLNRGDVNDLALAWFLSKSSLGVGSSQRISQEEIFSYLSRIYKK